MLWTLMGLCEQRPSLACDYRAIERNIRTNHSANGALWVGIAGNMLGNGRDDAVFDAISQALAAPTYDNYFTDQLFLLERGLAAFEKLTDDIERLKTTDGYEQCNFVTNPYMRL